MKFEITSTLEFTAGHALRLYDGHLEKHHVHVWKLRTVVGSEKLDSIGVVLDFHVLNHMLKEIVSPWEGKSLNETVDFAQLNPSAENVAMTIAQKLKLPEGVALVEVEVWETKGNTAIYRG